MLGEDVSGKLGRGAELYVVTVLAPVPAEPLTGARNRWCWGQTSVVPSWAAWPCEVVLGIRVATRQLSAMCQCRTVHSRLVLCFMAVALSCSESYLKREEKRERLSITDHVQTALLYTDRWGGTSSSKRRLHREATGLPPLQTVTVLAR